MVPSCPQTHGVWRLPAPLLQQAPCPTPSRQLRATFSVARLQALARVGIAKRRHEGRWIPLGTPPVNLPPVWIEHGSCSPRTEQPPPLLTMQPGPEGKVERWKEGSRSAAGPPPHATPPPSPLPPTLSPPPGPRGPRPPPAGNRPAKWARPARAAGIWCPLQLAVRRAPAPALSPTALAINNAPGEPGVAQPWPARNPCEAGTAPSPRGRILQGPCRRPVGQGVLGGLPSSTRGPFPLAVGSGHARVWHGAEPSGKGDGRPWLGDLTPPVVCVTPSTG